ncbi:hypothetical protein [Agrococcus jejuensis]|uniref:Uncharacterized protein n=1 Tax=Agrococcus jejuensis TaxID=399736 RepID=A0A1G8CKE7_9MICO|nr:hypothetical protein [Agrococcus jejuensis]SDH45905.1 hypothetical protein SAMN04489720_1322 [Agrococcus jejuensis]
MTTDERLGYTTSAPTLAPNPEAQRAYAASIAPPPKPQLPQAMTGRARFAGGVGGAMMLVGADLAGLGLLLLLLPLVLESFVRWMASLLPDVDPGAAATSVEQLYTGPWPWLTALVALVGIGLAAAGVTVSVRALRAAGFAHPVRITIAAFGLALGARIVLNIFTAPFSSLLSPLLERGFEGLADGGIAAVGTVVGLLIACAMNVAIASATGMLTWWFVAHLTRPAAPEPEPEEPAWSNLLRHHHLPH